MINEQKNLGNESPTVKISLNIKDLNNRASNMDDSSETWRVITSEDEKRIIALDIPLLDIKGMNKESITKIVSELAVQILNSSKRVERESLRKKQADGIAAAKARGICFGRRKIPVTEEFFVLQRLHNEGKITAREAADKLGVSHSTFLKWKKLYSE